MPSSVAARRRGTVTMISAVLLINAKGDIVISRVYRDDVTINTANSFRMKVIAAKETGSDPPIKQINKTHFLYIRHRNMFFVAVTTANANASLCFEFLMAMIKIFQVRACVTQPPHRAVPRTARSPLLYTGKPPNTRCRSMLPLGLGGLRERTPCGARCCALDML